MLKNIFVKNNLLHSDAGLVLMNHVKLVGCIFNYGLPADLISVAFKTIEIAQTDELTSRANDKFGCDTLLSITNLSSTQKYVRNDDSHCVSLSYNPPNSKKLKHLKTLLKYKVTVEDSVEKEVRAAFSAFLQYLEKLSTHIQYHLDFVSFKSDQRGTGLTLFLSM